MLHAIPVGPFIGRDHTGADRREAEHCGRRYDCADHRLAILACHSRNLITTTGEYQTRPNTCIFILVSFLQINFCKLILEHGPIMRGQVPLELVNTQ